MFELCVRTSEPRGGNTLRRYEILFIAHADSSDDNLNELIERYKAIITDRKGVIVKIDKWGTRRLAYEIRKQTKGIYVLVDFAGESSIVPELERNFKIDDKILKFITVVKDKEVDLLELQKKEEATEPEAEAKVTTPEPSILEISTNTATAPTVGEEPTETTQEERE